MKWLTDGSERKVNRDGQPGAAPVRIVTRHGVAAEKVLPLVSGARTGRFDRFAGTPPWGILALPALAAG